MSGTKSWVDNFPSNIHKFVPLDVYALFADIDSAVVQAAISHQLKIVVKHFVEAKFESASIVSQILLDITWEHLNTGYWKDVNINWRFLYYQVSVVKVLCECALIKQSTNLSYKAPIKTCDMGLLMGAPPGGNSLTEIVRELHKMQNYSPGGAVSNSKRSCKINEDGSTEKRQRLSWSEECGYVDVSPKTMIRHVECPSLEQFQNNFMNTESPVIIQGAIDYWPALSNREWTIEYIRETAGYRTVPVEIGSRYTEESWSQSLMTVNDFIDKHIMTPPGDQKVGYLAQHQLFEQIPELEKDISIPTYCSLGEKEDVDINAWFGPKGTISPLHQDPKHNLLAQVVGSKYVKMYSVDQTQWLYPYDGMIMSNTSQVDVECPDLETFPLFKQAHCLECILKAGDLLYIPPKYWHYLRSLSVSFSVSFWWQ